ncbi:MAG: AzlC family ABC transporter permease [Bradyrhizobiaceae bacterium]|nr:AzlC family ABC transporter permease [Bradyrhizobiaceae bacterium]
MKSVQGVVLFASFVGFGGLIRDIGFPLGAAVLSTLLVWALPAQVLLAGGYAAGNAAPVIALAVGLSSVRLFPMAAAILPYLRSSRRGIGVQFLAAHFVAVTAWIEGMRRLPNVAVEGRLPFFFGLSATLVLSSMIATAMGFYLAGLLPRALAIGLLFLTPLSFLIQLSHNARDLVDRLALAFGLALAPLFAAIGGRLDLLWTGLVGGGAAWAVHRFMRRRRKGGGQ